MWKSLWKTIHQSYIFIALIGGIIIGTILSLVFRVGFFSSPLWLVLVLILFLYAFIKPNYFFLVVAFFAGILIAFVRTSSELVGQDYVKNFVGETVEITGQIKDDPNTDESGTQLKLTDLEINNTKMRGAIFVKASKIESVQRDDKIKITGKLSEGFGIYAASIYRPEIKEIAHPNPENVFITIRNWFAKRVKESLPEKEASLGLAYILGMKNNLSDELMEILRIVGLTHIVVASGTHLSIIVEFAKKWFKKISRFAGLLFSLVLVFGFGSMAGWTASIMRAAIVTVLSLVAWYYGRKFGAMRLILIAMATTLLINPMFLIDIGWLLSFGSFIGIMILGPELTKFFYGKKKPNKIAEIIITTIAATAMCAPILLYYFGTISLISLAANLLILPTLSIVMGLVFFAGITKIGFLAKIALDYHLVVMEFFGAQKMFLIEIEAGNPWVFLLYIPIICPLVIIKIKRFRHRRDLCYSF